MNQLFSDYFHLYYTQKKTLDKKSTMLQQTVWIWAKLHILVGKLARPLSWYRGLIKAKT